METKALTSILIVMVLIIGIGIVMAHENFDETKKLIDSNVSCNKFSDEQLEEIGDYLMEQMHPGEAHEMMHKMMGGEDSETTKLMHINMAKGIYCGENVGMNSMMSGGMMNNGMMNMMGGNMTRGQTPMQTNMMQGMMGNNMMGSGMMAGRGMMNNHYQNPQNNGIYQNSFLGFEIFFYVILTLITVVLILVTILLISKSRNNTKQKRGKQNERQ